MKEFNDKIIEILKKIKEQSKKSNFVGCKMMARDLIRLSNIFNNAEGVFIGEFLESYFDQLGSLLKAYEIEEKTLKENIGKLAEAIDISEQLLLNMDEATKVNFLEKIKDARYLLTKTQIKYWTEEKHRLPSDVSEFIRTLR